MNTTNFQLATGWVNANYIKQAEESRKAREKLVRILLSNRKLPETGWDDTSIRLFLQEIASMDSNNFPKNIGVGEREARIFSSIVRERNYGLGHGIGRSGDISALQPKAAGSSLLVKLADCLALDAIREAGLKSVKRALVLPVATGMAMTLVFLAFREKKPHANKIIFSRIDQKSCVKCIQTAGYEVVVIDNLVRQDEVCTDIESIKATLEKQVDSILCVVSTTSCFAPRAPDDVVMLSHLCEQFNVFHVINNAYGIQSKRFCGLLEAACQFRVDVIVQSTDKNFMVPVGGAILVSPYSSHLSQIAQIYPGRASAHAHIDLVITLLQMGRDTWHQLLESREMLFPIFKERLAQVAEKYNERILETSNNPISVAITLDRLEESGFSVEFFGSMLFTRFISGTRVVPKNNSHKSKICGIYFRGGFGAHTADYQHSYLTAACALGITLADIDNFCHRLEECFQEAYQQVLK
eukprot:jgi/Galph1/1035/GphlegSOOS_G5773.1